MALKEKRVSTRRADIELKGVFDQIQAAEKLEAENLRLEEQAAKKGIILTFILKYYRLSIQLRLHPMDVNAPLVFLATSRVCVQFERIRLNCLKCIGKRLVGNR